MIEQQYTSAKSSIKQVPADFKIVDKYYGWKPFTNNLDIGTLIMCYIFMEKILCKIFYFKFFVWISTLNSL